MADDLEANFSKVIVTDLVPLRDVGKYLSFAGLVWAIADVAGPLMGGAFAQYDFLLFLSENEPQSIR